MATVRVGDIDISYEIRGSGHPLVLLMGYSGNKDWWPPELVDALAARYQLLLFDNRGTGYSTDNGCYYDISKLAADTIGLMDALGIDQAHIFGISMGGLIGQEIALKNAAMVKQLVLGCTGCGPFWGEKFSLNGFNLLFDYFTKPEVRDRNLMTNLFFSQRFLTEHPDKVQSFTKRAGCNPTGYETKLKQIAAMLRFDSFFRLGQIQTPALVMTGTEDCMVPPRNSDILVGRMKDARLIKFKGCGHGFVTEAAQRVAEQLNHFLLS